MCVKNICSPWRVGKNSSISGARWNARFSSSRALVRCSLKPSRAELPFAGRGKIRNRSNHFHTAALDMAWGHVTYRASSLALPALGGRSFAQKKNIWLQSTPAALITSYHTILDSLAYAKYLTISLNITTKPHCESPLLKRHKINTSQGLLPSCTFLCRHYKGPYYGTGIERANRISYRAVMANHTGVISPLTPLSLYPLWEVTPSVVFFTKFFRMDYIRKVPHWARWEIAHRELRN